MDKVLFSLMSLNNLSTTGTWEYLKSTVIEVNSLIYQNPDYFFASNHYRITSIITYGFTTLFEYDLALRSTYQTGGLDAVNREITSQTSRYRQHLFMNGTTNFNDLDNRVQAYNDLLNGWQDRLDNFATIR